MFDVTSCVYIPMYVVIFLKIYFFGFKCVVQWIKGEITRVNYNVALMVKYYISIFSTVMILVLQVYSSRSTPSVRKSALRLSVRQSVSPSICPSVRLEQVALPIYLIRFVSDVDTCMLLVQIMPFQIFLKFCLILFWTDDDWFPFVLLLFLICRFVKRIN